jgi:FKBP-type peptidyl-prolyl cis-trans isomerase
VVEDLVEGTGAVAEVGDDLGVRYIGVNYRTGEEFEDSSDATFEFELGSGFANAGWERGLRGMRAGGRRELIVPRSLAPFGKEALIYVVDLLSVR